MLKVISKAGLDAIGKNSAIPGGTSSMIGDSWKSLGENLPGVQSAIAVGGSTIGGNAVGGMFDDRGESFWGRVGAATAAGATLAGSKKVRGDMSNLKNSLFGESKGRGGLPSAISNRSTGSGASVQSPRSGMSGISQPSGGSNRSNIAAGPTARSGIAPVSLVNKAKSKVKPRGPNKKSENITQPIKKNPRAKSTSTAAQ